MGNFSRYGEFQLLRILMSSAVAITSWTEEANHHTFVKRGREIQLRVNDYLGYKKDFQIRKNTRRQPEMTAVENEEVGHSHALPPSGRPGCRPH